MIREIVLDTETTGLRANDGDRIVEIAALELVNHLPTGKTWHRYVNPERDMPEEAYKVHGLSEDFLKDHPVFARLADEFLEFVGKDRLIIHNAPFDMGFLNAELKRAGKRQLPMEQAVDTVAMARRKFPGSPASLDALCRRYNISNAHRSLHGALIDADLLASVYLELIGGRQTGLGLDPGEKAPTYQQPSDLVDSSLPAASTNRPARAKRDFPPTPEERAAHDAMLKGLTNPLWLAGAEKAEAD